MRGNLTQHLELYPGNQIFPPVALPCPGQLGLGLEQPFKWGESGHFEKHGTPAEWPEGGHGYTHTRGSLKLWNSRDLFITLAVVWG